MDEAFVKNIVEEVISRLKAKVVEEDTLKIPIAVSNRHIHLSYADLETLFGSGYNLTVLKPLSQPGQYAAEETVTLVGQGGVIEKVRVLGPPRKRTQVEISFTDGWKIGITPPVRDSGNLKDTPGVVVVGPRGVVNLKEGVICALRHIHMTPSDSIKWGVGDGEIVKVKIEGDRGLIFDEVLVRVNKDYSLEMHIDTDEANACGLIKGGWGVLIKRND